MTPGAATPPFVPGDIVKVREGLAHGKFVGIVDHLNGIGQAYVIPIDGSSYSPKYLFEQGFRVIPEERWTDGQFQAYAKWRDARAKAGGGT